MNRKIYQDQYDFELNQRNHLTSSVNVPIMVVIVVGGVVSSMVLNVPYALNASSIVFSLASIICAIFLLISICLLFGSSIGYKYMKLPPPSELDRYYEELLQWHKNNGTETDARNDFDDYLYERLGESVEVNSNNNINRGNFLHMATIMIAVATLFLAISGAIYVYAKLQNGQTPYKVQIIGTVDMK
uniref:Uncharacterized protein n=1 Tax=Candidatus Kentrum sp. LFY TaxID=2126342 RepID=A0A450UMQ1_9GAMM|nr:MAG: hypothetical protein BECKLFY1418B_GA0070995_10508 [Candidatus Kentron sp. LFY]